MRKKETTNDVIVQILAIIIILACIGGYIANIVKIFVSMYSPITGEIIVRLISVFVWPIGIIMGYV